VWEYNRSTQSAKEKQEKKRQQIKEEQDALRAKLHALDIRLKAVEEAVKEQTDTLLGIATVKKKRKYKEPPPEELVPIDDDIDNKDSRSKAPIIDNSNSFSPESSTPVRSRPWYQFW